MSTACSLLALFLAVAGLARGASPHDWIPARWHSHDPATLSVVKASPVNCLLLEAGDWDRTFVKAASRQGVSTLGVVRPNDAPPALIRRAAEIGVSGLVFEGDFDRAALDAARNRARVAGLAVIELPSRARIRVDSGDSITGTHQALWPGLEIEHGGKIVAGPTSAPWIHTNGGFLRWVRARTGATVWLAVQPPSGTVFPVERYLQAIGDAAIPGARWVLALDADFESRLYRRDPDALKDWNRISAHLRFYERWPTASNFGKFGVVIDRDTGGLLSSFLLDMLAAQRTSARVIPPGRLTPSSLGDVSVLLDLGRGSLSTAERSAVQDYASRGGIVLDPPPGIQFPPPDVNRITPTRRELDRLQGLWEAVYHATLRKNFGVRAFNTSGILTGVTTPDGGRSIVVHLLNFMDYPGEAITVHALGGWQGATLHTPEAPPQQLTVHPVQEGTAVEVDRFATAVAVEFQR